MGFYSLPFHCESFLRSNTDFNAPLPEIQIQVLLNPADSYSDFV